MKMHIGQKIKLARTIRGYTQELLADKIHKTRPMITHIEKTGNVSYETLLLICTALKITPNDLDNISAETFGFNEKKIPEELEYIIRENILLKELVEQQKQRIRQLEESLNRYKKL
jgi:transcriptional regulator with XRE-family HTH domain